MQSLKPKQHPAPTVASSDDYLPGLAPFEGGAETPGHQLDATNRSGWWVRRSEKQVTDAAGLPVGYRHQLMHGRKVIKSGVGPDYARTFREQACFLNALDKRTQQQVVTTTGAPMVTTSPAWPHNDSAIYPHH
jgi:hypothetical protein